MEMENHHEIRLSQQSEFEVPLFMKFESMLKKIYTENRQVYRSRKMDRVFKRGVFADEIEMLIEIMKERASQYHEKYKPLVLQNKPDQRTKLNTKDAEER